jgi:prolyl 4-hydroxylase
MKSEIIDYGDKYVQTIENVFSKEECEELIKISEDKGYNPASLFTDKFGKEHFVLDKRKGLRCIIDDLNFADKLLHKIYQFIPKTYKNMKLHSINNRLRFLKYNSGDFFKRHSDGNYISENGSISQITILIYLNDDYTDAYTTFFKDPDDYDGYVIKPSIGMLCLMDQKVGHEVNPLSSGIKYVIRTELMYK